jgi:hypothetical protein
VKVSPVRISDEPHFNLRRSLETQNLNVNGGEGRTGGISKCFGSKYVWIRRRVKAYCAAGSIVVSLIAYQSLISNKATLLSYHFLRACNWSIPLGERVHLRRGPPPSWRSNFSNRKKIAQEEFSWGISIKRGPCSIHWARLWRALMQRLITSLTLTWHHIFRLVEPTISRTQDSGHTKSMNVSAWRKLWGQFITSEGR